MKLDKQFIGAGMDFDSSNEFIDKFDVISAFNCRSLGTAQSELGCITSIEGNVLVEHSMPVGINKCIGAKAFDDVSKAYFFIYNSNSFHRIEEYNFDTNKITTVFENKTDSAGADILKLKPKKPVKDILLIDGSLLKFNDANSSPKEIDVVRKLNGEYGVVTSSDLEQIKAQPLRKMMVKYVSNPSRNINSVSKKLFQFRYKYVYLNNEESAWSVYSDRVTPTDEPTPSQVTDVTKNNGLEISLDIGTNRVKDIVISGRVGNQDWFTIKTVSREDILKIPNKVINISQEVYEAHVGTSPNINLFDTIGLDPFSVKNSYVFLFYYDGLFEYDDPLLTDLAHDNLPRVANAMEIANGNVIVFGGLREGYPRPKQDIKLGVTYYDPQITITPTDFSDAMHVEYDQDRNSGTHKRTVVIKMFGLPKTGDKITISMVVITNGQIYELAEYYVPSSQNNLLSQVATSLASLIPGASVGQINPVGNYITFVSESFQELSSVTIDFAHKTTGESKSIPVLKSNSSYQPALGYKDEFGRFLPIQTDKDFILNTRSLAQTSGLVPKIDWQINSEFAPEGARTYQWLLSKNNTHLNMISFNGSFLAISDGSYIDISLKSMIEFNKENPSSILGYDWAEGDRCTFLYYLDNSDVPMYFNSSIIDVDVVSFGPKMSNPVEGEEQVIEDYILKVRRPSSIDISGFYGGASLIGKELLLEIYSPKKGTSSEEVKVYYEVGDVYDVTPDGKHSVTSGSITAGDVYYKTRETGRSSDLNKIQVFKVEDFNFSDYYESKFYSLGRPRSYYDTPEDVYLKASVRFSGTYNKYTDNNGLTRFFKENIVDYDEVYGGIQFLEQRGNMIICLQELKVGYIPVNQSIIEDQAGQQNVAVSEVLLNKIRYSSGIDLGIGKAINSFVSYGGFIYFVDPNKCEPVRAGLDGIDTISKKASKYFKNTIREIYASGRDIVGLYDSRNNEYIISYATPEDEVISVDFSSAKWDSVDSFEVQSQNIAVAQAQTLGTATYDSFTGVATFTPTAGVVGQGHIKFSFTSGTVQIVRGECINIAAPKTTPTPFNFFNKVNVNPSTVYESNTIGISGITVPIPISVNAGQYSINNGPWTSANGMVSNGDVVKYRITSSATAETTTSGTMTIGPTAAVFFLKTKPVMAQVYAHVGTYGSKQLRVEFRSSEVYGQGSLVSVGCNVAMPLAWDAAYYGPISLDPEAEVPDGTTLTPRTQTVTINSGQSLVVTTAGGSHDLIKTVTPKTDDIISMCGGADLRVIYVIEPSLTTGDPNPSASPYVYDSTHLQSYRDALATVATRPLNILAIGDSITEGKGASSRQTRWQDMLLSKLRGQHQPDGISGGLGYIPSSFAMLDALVSPITYTGSYQVDAYTNFGLGTRYARLSAGATASLNFYGTGIDILYPKGNQGATLSYNVDGGTVTGSVNQFSATAVDGFKVEVRGLARGVHTVVLSAPTNNGYFEGIFVYDQDETSGIRMWDAGHSGFRAIDLLIPSSYDVYSLVDPDLIIIGFGTNDYGRATGKRTPAQFKADYKDLIAMLRSKCTNDPSIIMNIPNQRDTATISGAILAPWTEYVQALKEVAQEDGAITMVDWDAVLGSWATSDPKQLSIADRVHPNTAGYLVLANRIMSVIEGAN